jgi:hypothetical protein
MCSCCPYSLLATLWLQVSKTTISGNWQEGNTVEELHTEFRGRANRIAIHAILRTIRPTLYRLLPHSLLAYRRLLLTHDSLNRVLPNKNFPCPPQVGKMYNILRFYDISYQLLVHQLLVLTGAARIVYSRASIEHSQRHYFTKLLQNQQKETRDDSVLASKG